MPEQYFSSLLTLQVNLTNGLAINATLETLPFSEHLSGRHRLRATDGHCSPRHRQRPTRTVCTSTSSYPTKHRVRSELTQHALEEQSSHA